MHALVLARWVIARRVISDMANAMRQVVLVCGATDRCRAIADMGRFYSLSVSFNAPQTSQPPCLPFSRKSRNYVTRSRHAYLMRSCIADHLTYAVLHQTKYNRPIV